MPESVFVSVRCPACRGAHRHAAPSYPCVRGAPVGLPLDGNAVPAPVVHRVWQDDWVTVRCGDCGRPGEWPRPELGCPCGTVLRIPLADPGTPPGPGTTPAPSLGPRETGAAPHPAFRSVQIRSVRDAVTATVLYLRRLGHGDIRRADQPPPSGIGPAGASSSSSTRPRAGRHRGTWSACG